MGDVRVVPLCAGTAVRKRSLLVEDAEPDLLELTFTMFYVRSGDRHIVVDTGIAAPEETQAHHHPVERTARQDPVAALAGIGVDPAEVDVVVNTHLHWDHCGSNHLFPNARVLVQRDELHYAIAPSARDVRVYDEIAVEDGKCVSLPNFLRAKLTPVDGEFDLTDDVRVIRTPGHTPGSQSVVVAGTETYLLAGDNVPLLDNIEGPRFRPNASYTDLEEYLASIRRSRQLSTRVLPSHDARVFDQAEYR